MSFQELLNPVDLENITKDCRTCGNMSCRVESDEKPVDNCLGYINHKFDKREKQRVKTMQNK